MLFLHSAAKALIVCQIHFFVGEILNQSKAETHLKVLD